MPGRRQSCEAPMDLAPSAVTDTAHDAELVAAARADPRAFARLYRRYVDSLYRYCFRRLGSKEAAEDAVSLIFMKALEALPHYRAGTFRGWIFAIAHNVVVDSYRSQRPSDPLPPAVEVEDAAPGPEALALIAEEAGSIRDLLARLPPDQRHVIELRLAGLTVAEIAQALGRSQGSVRTAQYRALKRLRGFFEVDANAKETGCATGR